MPFKKRGNIRYILLDNLILKQYKSIKRYFIRQSYTKTIPKHKKILLIQRRVLLKQACTKTYTKNRTKSYIIYNIVTKAKAHTLI
jgi:hypothetical protein